MRSIDPKWTELSAGHQAVLALQARLESEFGRAVQAGRKQKFRRELTEWQKKRRVFFVLAGIAPLSIITLCLIAYYRREVACVIVYWVMLVGIVLVTLAVAGRNYIRELMNRPNLDELKKLPVDLEQRWWDSLFLPGQLIMNAEGKDYLDFLESAGQALPGIFQVSYFPDTILFSSGGLWLFQVISASGTIVRQAGVWQQVKIAADKMGRKQSQVVSFPSSPDEEWLQRKKELLDILNIRLPQQAWSESLIQGGIVFTNPDANLDKSRIQGNVAAYGTPRAWVARIRNTSAFEGFTLDIQLDMAEALQKSHPGTVASAKELAYRLYQDGALELRGSIEKMVGATG